MVLIELFDVATSENITGFLSLKPDTVYFVGDFGKILRYSDIYKKIAARNGITDVEIYARGASRNNFNKIVELLCKIIDLELEKDSEAEIIIDLCGGEDLALVAVGVVCEKYGDRIKLHRFNVNTGCTNDCDSGVIISENFEANIMIDEYISLCGGKIEYASNGHGTVLHDFTNSFVKDLCKMWNICKKDHSMWNACTSKLGHLIGLTHSNECLSLCFNKEVAKLRISDCDEFFDVFLKSLVENGLIKNFVEDKGFISFDFKNDTIKHCLMQSGQVLELYVTYVAKNVADASGKHVFSDAMTGVYLDWDGVDPKETFLDVENEIDILLISGVTPIFISCKNGSFETDEFYKLCAVANRFGGRYSKKVIVSPYLAIAPDDKLAAKKQALVSRARQMGIKVIDSTCLGDDSLLVEELMKLI